MERLGVLCDIAIGKTPSRARRDFWGPGHPWLSIADMNQGRDLTTTTEQITEQALKESRHQLVAPGTVLMSFKLSIGKLGIARTPMFTNEAIAHLPIRDENALIPDYLYWALAATELAKGADRAAMGATLNSAKLSDIAIPVPPLLEQRRIAVMLDRAEALRTKRRLAMRQLERVAESLFIDEFGDPLRDPGRWPTEKLGDLVDKERRITYGILKPGSFVPDGVPMLRIQDIRDGMIGHTFHRVSPELSTQYKRTVLRGGEIVISLVGTLGIVAQIPQRLAGANLHRNLGMIALRTGVDSDYLYEYLRLPEFRASLWQRIKGGNQGLLNLGELEMLEVPTPPPALQRRFVERIRQTRMLSATHRASLAALDALARSVQYRAFRAEL